jgi:hypothetical protein
MLACLIGNDKTTSKNTHLYLIWVFFCFKFYGANFTGNTSYIAIGKTQKKIFILPHNPVA